jgi:signal transduction histidine kinase
MGVGRWSFEHVLRLALIAIAAAGTVLSRSGFNYGFYVVMILVFTLNSQVRMLVFKGPFFLFSLFADIGIIYFINSRFEGLSILLLFIPLLDSVLYLDTAKYAVSGAVLALLAYLSWDKLYKLDYISTAFFLFVVVLGFQVQRLRRKVSEMEALYDENRKYSYQLEDAKKRLEEYSKRVEQVSQLEERNRISREIHDSIGHKLTGVLMQVDAAMRVFDADPVKGREMLVSIRDNMSGCVDVLRETVRNIKPKDNGGRILSIQQMASDFSKSTGVDISLQVMGSPVKLFPSAEITLYRNAQEAITNAVRHGKARNIRLTLEYREDEVVLAVKDDGAGCAEPVKGMGISGMEERAALVGGRVMLSSEDGFLVKTILPVRAG